MFQVFSQLQTGENKKATIIVVVVKIKEERSSEVQTAFMVITFYLKKLLLQASDCEAMRVRNKKATIIVVASTLPIS
ncbi:MAG: hypothetical protein IKC88_02170, partial [Opitutales bacterium]|nr:hypothetical protein [Opitutales bacterium]